MFHFEDLLLIGALLLFFVFPVTVGNARFSFGGCMGIEHSDRYVLSKRPPQNPFTALSSFVPSVALEVSLDMASPVVAVDLVLS